MGRIIAIRGAVSSGNPWNVTAGGVEAVSDTSGSIPGATTTVTNTLVVTAIATSLPDETSTAKFSGWTNANLTSLTERTDNSVTAGNGGGKYFSPYGNPRLEDGPQGEHLPDRLATETAKFIEANKDKPFLAYLAFYSVHTPLMSRKNLQEKYKKKKEQLGLQETWGDEGDRKVRQTQAHAVYGGMVEAMDLAAGKVLDKVKALGLEDNTIVIFMSDNGGLSTSEGSPTSNLPLRGGKGWLYEGGIREPMIIKWPGVTKPGSRCGQYVTSTDFYPTMLEMAGLPAMPEQHLDGMSMVPLLKGGNLDRGPIFWHYPHYGNQGGFPGGTVRDGKWKLIENYAKKTVELYDLDSDISEKQNLAAKRPKIVKQLQAKLADFRRETGALMPTPYPMYKKQ